MTRFYFKLTIFILSLLGIAIYLGLQINSSEKIHNKAICYLTNIINENTPFKNIKITYSSVSWGKWQHPFSFYFHKVDLQDKENGSLSIEKLYVSWSITNFIKGQFNPSWLSIQKGQLHHHQQFIGDADFTIDLNPSELTLTLDHLYVNPETVANLDICPQTIKSFLKNIYLPLKTTGHVHFKEQELTSLNLTAIVKKGHFLADPYFPLPISLHDLQVNISLESLQKINAHLKVATDDTQLSVQSQFIFPSSIMQLWQEGGKINVTLVGETTNVQVNDLSKLWPVELAPKPRNWVTKNLSQGHVNGTLHAQATLHTNSKGSVHDIILDELSGELFPTGVTVNYLGKLPCVH